MWSKVHITIFALTITWTDQKENGASRYHRNVLDFIFSIREYKVSKSVQGKWSKAMTICKNLNLGLVIWDTEETFEDMRTITGSSNGFFDKPAWTALNNADNKSCTSAPNCNGKLVT